MKKADASSSEPPELKALWESWLADLGWQPSEQQQQQLQQLYPLVMAGNRTQNLTRITDPIDFWEKHLWDSLRGLRLLGSWEAIQAQPWRGIDIGTGAGFPGIPAQIALPQTRFTLLDSTQRKIAFVQDTLQRLSLTQARAVAQRAEIWGQDPQERGSYDIALARALASAETCAEYCLPLLKVGGRAIPLSWPLDRGRSPNAGAGPQDPGRKTDPCRSLHHTPQPWGAPLPIAGESGPHAASLSPLSRHSQTPTVGPKQSPMKVRILSFHLATKASPNSRTKSWKDGFANAIGKTKMWLA